MAEADLHKFIEKVKQLSALVDSLDRIPGRRDQLAACQNHTQVVLLARSWGYEIGRRWGDVDTPADSRAPSNLLNQLKPQLGKERHRLIHSGPNWRLELIHSSDASSSSGYWYDQPEHEWITLLRGSATLLLKDPDESLDLSVADQVHLVPHRLHRVERTDPPPGTVWLALFWRDLESAV